MFLSTTFRYLPRSDHVTQVTLKKFGIDCLMANVLVITLIIYITPGQNRFAIVTR
jgi:hypothetical protein